MTASMQKQVSTGLEEACFFNEMSMILLLNRGRIKIYLGPKLLKEN